MDSIPITNLDPDTAPPSDKSIRAIVTLSWPYSSSTKQCALLLADPDFRLRNRKGQVRARFTGASAEAVATAHVGIGDEVVLSLDGALWEQDFEANRTPGRSVDGELLFRRRLVLNVKRDGGEVEINVDAPVSPVRSPAKPVELATPLPKTITSLLQPLDGTSDSVPSYTYTSPAFVKRLRLSGESFLDSAYDPFSGDDDAALAAWNERKRASFGSNLRWRYQEKTPSPKKVQFANEVSSAQDATAEQEPQQVAEPRPDSPSKNTRSKTKMLPPPLPDLQMPATKPTDGVVGFEPHTTSDGAQEGPSTPEIRPVQSPTLPLPSPFPFGDRQVQFGVMEAGTAPQKHFQQQQETSAGNVGALTREEDEDGDVEMLDEQFETSIEKSQVYPEPTSPGRKSQAVSEEILQQQPNVVQIIEGSPEVVSTEPIQGITEQIPFVESEMPYEPAQEIVEGTVIVEPEVQEEPAKEATEQATSVEAEVPSPGAPQTPIKQTNIGQQLALGLDGASSAPSSAHATPQSEKEKIMAQTYRSLFGFEAPVDASPVPTQSKVQQQTTDNLTGTMWFSDVAKAQPETANASTAEVDTPRDEVSIEVASSAPGDAPQSMAAEKSAQDSHRLPHPPSASQPQIEIIDLASSSESEDEEVEEEAPVQAVTPRRAPKLEVQDSAADPEDEHLLAQESQAFRRIAGVHARQRQASQLPEMIAEAVPDVVINKTTQPEALEEDGWRQQETEVISRIDNNVVQAQSVSQDPDLTSPRISPVRVTVSDSSSAPTNRMPLSHGELDAETTSISPLKTLAEEHSTVATSSFEQQAMEEVSEVLDDTEDIETLPALEPVHQILELAETGTHEGVELASIIRSDSPSPEYNAPRDERMEDNLLNDLAPPEPIDLVSPVEEYNLALIQPTESAIRDEFASAQQVDLVSPVGVEHLFENEPRIAMEMQSPPPTVASPMESMFAENREPPTQLPAQRTQTPLYPSLPLSPSNSQSLQDMPSQDERLTLQDTLTGVFPPTPQLTQVESFTEAELVTVEADAHRTIADVIPEELRSDLPADVVDRASQQALSQEAQLVRQPSENMSTAEAPSSQAEMVEEERPLSQLPKRKMARKTLPAKTGNVPEVISPWFSPKRASGIELGRPSATDVKHANTLEEQVTNVVTSLAASKIAPQREAINTNGFSTALSYFTPLSRLEELLNPSSQQAYGTTAVDIIAVVTDRTKEPVRAKAGPRDYYTIFKVTDSSLAAQHDVRVEIYRPWHATLPVAYPGDIVLLRAFAVKSRKRQTYLLSTDASAWCVWRYGESTSTEGGPATKPVRARKGVGADDSVREETKGPPVELGDEERDYALRLKQWWKTVESDGPEEQDNDAQVNGGMNAPMSQPIAAKL